MDMSDLRTSGLPNSETTEGSIAAIPARQFDSAPSISTADYSLATATQDGSTVVLRESQQLECEPSQGVPGRAPGDATEHACEAAAGVGNEIDPCGHATLPQWGYVYNSDEHAHSPWARKIVLSLGMLRSRLPSEY